MSRVNIQMVQYSLGTIAQFPECGFHPRGYLFLGNESNWNKLQRRYEIQKSLGAECELLDVAGIRKLVPELSCDDLRGGLFGPKDGYLDPRALLGAFRKQAEKLGATYVSGEAPTTNPGTVCVIAAGAYSAVVGRSFGVEVPVAPVRQQLFRCALPRPWTYEFPVVIDPDGTHWRTYPNDEIVIAKTNPNETPGFRFEADLERFHQTVKPELARRLPEFRDLKLISGWGGLYEMTPDHNGIIDRISDRLYIAAGFSGHGLMMSAATGKLMSELIRLGRFQTLDASVLSLGRFARNELFWDEAMI
jgi:glycine/D-amino acid oxidase-like deaminating enzyme